MLKFLTKPIGLSNIFIVIKMKEVLIPGFGGFLAVFIIGLIGDVYQTVLLIAPFGASSVIAFALPENPVAQPRNIIGGHIVSTLTGLLILELMPVTPYSMGIAVGLAITLMLLTKTIHPPAGADTVLVMITSPSWYFVIWPVAVGAFLIFSIAFFYNRLRRIKYPLRWF